MLSNSPVRIADIDDHTLVLILQKMQPLDRFNASSVCKRFYNVAQDAKLWIHVRVEDAVNSSPEDFHLPTPYTTLEAAVLASRPGDSILIGPGEHIVEGLSISHPLRLIGSPGCKLMCQRTAAEAALEIFSNVRVEGVSMVATRAFCIRHNDGELHLSRCKLTCHSEHLSHLYSALVAASRQRQSSTADMDRPAGRLTVEETSITGSMRAVLCQGDGELVDVRVLGSACGHCFWFEVRQDVLRSQQSRAVRRKRDVGGTQAADSLHGTEGQGGDGGGGGGERSCTRAKQLVPGARQTRLQARRRQRSRDGARSCTEAD